MNLFEQNTTAVSDEDSRNDPVIWKAACLRLMNSINVIERGIVRSTDELEITDAQLVAVMLAGFAFENAFKAKFLQDGGVLYKYGKIQNFKDHSFVRWADDYGITLQKLERMALDKAEFFCVAWGRYPTHNRLEEERPFEVWGPGDVEQLMNLIRRLLKGVGESPHAT